MVLSKSALKWPSLTCNNIKIEGQMFLPCSVWFKKKTAIHAKLIHWLCVMYQAHFHFTHIASLNFCKCSISCVLILFYSSVFRYKGIQCLPPRSPQGGRIKIRSQETWLQSLHVNSCTIRHCFNESCPNLEVRAHGLYDREDFSFYIQSVVIIYQQ